MEHDFMLICNAMTELVGIKCLSCEAEFTLLTPLLSEANRWADFHVCR